MRYARCVSQLAAVALAAGLLSGCGPDAAPTASSDGSALAPVAKRAPKSGTCTESATGAFTSAKGGKLQVKFRQQGKDGDIWVKKAVFEAARGALTETTDITMEVTSGVSFDDVMVAFGPPGTAFQSDGTLTLELWGEKAKTAKSRKSKKSKKSKKDDGYPSEEELQLAADHITADGTVLDVVLTTERRGAYKIIVTIAVPGFSLYGLRD